MVDRYVTKLSVDAAQNTQKKTQIIPVLDLKQDTSVTPYCDWMSCVTLPAYSQKAVPLDRAGIHFPAQKY